MSVKFHKMHGAGNDFILLDLRKQSLALDSDLVKRLANRHTGIGCDQILVLHPALEPTQLASFSIWNSDGSQAEQCGNGVRCMGLYLRMQREVKSRPFSLGGPCGEVVVQCLDGSDAEVNQVKVNMGRPDFEAPNLPLALPQDDGWYQLEAAGIQHRIAAVSMGNPHALLLVNAVEKTDVSHLGALISQHPAFPNGCNAGFAEILDRSNIRLRVFERGASETLACGSGACAAMTILRRAGLVNDRVNVTLTGGVLIISWTGGEKPVEMTGPATHVYKGIMT